LAKKHRKRNWAGKMPRLWTKKELKKEKRKILDCQCEWCAKHKPKKELELHHISWNLDESAYVLVWIDEYTLSREHKDGYSTIGTRLVCKECHKEIHRNPQEAELKGFKKASK